MGLWRVSSLSIIVEVRDYVLWPKHIYGDAPLRDRLLALPTGEPIKLIVDGETGTWVKMNDGKDGAPMPGLKPLGPARTHWHRLFRDQPGAVVSIALA
jgi:hypothetical protein